MALRHFPSPAEVSADKLGDLDTAKLEEVQVEIARAIEGLYNKMTNPAVSKDDRLFAFIEFEANTVFYKEVSATLISRRIKCTADRLKTLIGDQTELNVTSTAQLSRLSESVDGLTRNIGAGNCLQGTEIERYRQFIAATIPDKVNVLVGGSSPSTRAATALSDPVAASAARATTQTKATASKMVAA
jgi:hypothetical protein